MGSAAIFPTIDEKAAAQEHLRSCELGISGNRGTPSIPPSRIESPYSAIFGKPPFQRSLHVFTKFRRFREPGRGYAELGERQGLWQQNRPEAEFCSPLGIKAIPISERKIPVVDWDPFGGAAAIWGLMIRAHQERP